jgi:putative RNA 2'-phosphotransferase
MTMTDKKNYSKLGQKLAYLLRHDTNYEFPSEGWRESDDLIKNHGFTLEDLKEIVRNDNKGRFEWKDGTYTGIRAIQGHSISKIRIKYPRTDPPEVLYHGTKVSNLESIFAGGISSMERLYVHLSDNPETAFKVANRKNKTRKISGPGIVLEVDAKKMISEGYAFYLTSNGVWLTRFVPSKFIKILTTE